MATKYARLLLGCYRTGDANDPEVYVAAITAILSDYPEEIVRQVVDPRIGLPSRIQWLPTPAEVARACGELYSPTLRAREWERRSREQLAEREALESMPRPKQTYEEFKAEMARRGMPIDHQSMPTETAASIKNRFGISAEKWDAIPDLPKKVTDKDRTRLDRNV